MSRLDKMLADAGIGPRKEIQAMIKAGRVSVDGGAVKDPAAHFDAGREIRIDGTICDCRSVVYIMMNKPQGVVSSTDDPRDPTAVGLLPGRFVRMGVFPAGRLDKDSEGLLLITNDGALAHALTSPARHVDKLYEIVYDGELTDGHIELFAAGLSIGGDKCKPAKLERHAELRNVAYVTISEGMYHQVKRMFAACGMCVTGLRRLSIGPLRLDTALLPGEWRLLTDAETDSIGGRV